MSDLREALRVPKELVQEICADVMIGTYGIQGSLEQARRDVANRIEKWIVAALASQPSDLKAKLEALRELSEKATPGAWVRSKHCFQILTEESIHSVTELNCPRGLAVSDERTERWQNDVKFIVACVNTVRAILEGKD